MNRLGCKIDAMVMQQKRVPEKCHVAQTEELVNGLRFVARRPLRKSVATVIPTMVALNRTLASIPIQEQYDVTIAEGETAFSIFENPALQTAVRILRVHNNESHYMWSNSKTEESFVRRQFCRLEALRYFLFSPSAYRRVDFLWFISKRELQSFVAANPRSAAKAVWLPPSISFGDRPRRERSNRVLWVASLNNCLNREGLRWYLETVHPVLLQDPEYELVLAGSTSGRSQALLFARELQQQSRCVVHVDCSNLTQLYDRCAVFINPMQRGTGVKLKNIHAIERRIPVVTTSVGNEGSGFEGEVHVRIADSARHFAADVVDLLNDESQREQLATRAFAHLTEHYDCEANLKKLFSNLSPQMLDPKAMTTYKSGRAEPARAAAERQIC